jgi:hypothetical protein
MAAVLPALDEHQVERPHVAEQFFETRRRLIRQFADMRPAGGRRDDHFRRAGFSMQITVFAGMVDIKAVVRVLDGAHPPAAAGEFAHQVDDQRGLAGVLVAGNPENPDQAFFAQALHQPAAATSLPGKIAQGR